MDDRIVGGLPEGFIIRKDENLSYKIVKPLGQGGFAITYKAEKIDTQAIVEEVVIKEYFPYKALGAYRDTSNALKPWNVACNHSEFDYWLNKFNEEPCRIAQYPSLKTHLNIVRMKDFRIFCNDTCYYVMGFIKGKTVEEYVSQHGTFTEKEALEIVKKICSPVRSFHDNNLIHWDITYTNIIFELDDSEKVVKIYLIDFGLTKIYDEEGIVASKPSNVGTKGFIDVQLCGTKNFYPQADIYSIASVLYFMLYGSVRKLGEASLDFDGTISSLTKILIRKARGEEGFKQRPKNIEEFIGWIDTSLAKICSDDKVHATIPESILISKPIKIKKKDKLLKYIFLFLCACILVFACLFYYEKYIPQSKPQNTEKSTDTAPVDPVTPVDDPVLTAGEVNRWFNMVNSGEMTESDLLSRFADDAYFAIDRNGVLFEDPENMNYRVKNLFNATNYNYHIGKNYTVNDVYLNKDSQVETIILVKK